jgi:hypothetical protein
VGAALRKERKQAWPLFSADSETSCRIVRRVSMDEAEKFEAMGVWERRYDHFSGELMGFRLCDRKDDSDLPSSGWTPAAISTSEMETNAASFAFVGDWSRTAGLSEERRLEREKQGFPAEDHAERVQRKVLVFPHVGSAKKDILRVWPVDSKNSTKRLAVLSQKNSRAVQPGPLIPNNERSTSDSCRREVN